MSVLSIAGQPASVDVTGTEPTVSAGEKQVYASQGITKWLEKTLSGLIPWVDKVRLDWESLSPIASTLSGIVVIVTTMWGRFGIVDRLNNISASVPGVGV